MLDRIQAQSKEFTKKLDDKTINAEIIFTIVNLIATIDGKEPNPVTLEQWVRDLPMRDTNCIFNYADKLNSLIGLDVNLQMDCDVCGLTYDTFLQMNSEFFRPALDI